MDASEIIQRAMKNLKLELGTNLNEVICGSFEVKVHVRIIITNF